LSNYDAAVLTADKATAEYFENVVQAGADAKRACNLITQTGQKLANQNNTTVDKLSISPQNLAKLAQMADKGQISATAAAQIFEKMSQQNADPEQIAKADNLLQTSDAGAIEGIVDLVLAENGDAVKEIVSKGKKAGKAQGFLMGQVIQKSKGQANPKVAAEILSRKLAQMSS
jgi:aspartyl-tRNA(Asn)/glutamyl-tRNA(Gln) amidotransferase subunit B